MLHVLVQSDDSPVDPMADDFCTDVSTAQFSALHETEFFILSAEARKAQHS
jgi:hypothetical protein